MCDGPIELFKLRNVTIQGATTAPAKSDGIQLPALLSNNPYAALGVYESTGVRLSNLKINASNYVTGTYTETTTYSQVNALNVGQLSSARVYDVDFLGGDYGIATFAGAWLRTYDNVTVKDWNNGGVTARRGANVEFNSAITVTSALTSSETYSEAIAAGMNSSIEIRGGGTFSSSAAKFQRGDIGQ